MRLKKTKIRIQPLKNTNMSLKNKNVNTTVKKRNMSKKNKNANTILKKRQLCT